MQTTYEKNIASRTTCHYLKGLLIRWWKNLRYEHIRRVARRRGATIGEGVVMIIIQLLLELRPKPFN